MTPLKQVGLRLTPEQLVQVDALQSEGHASRSESLRYLVEAGLERHATERHLSSIDARLDRLAHVLERTHHLAFICFRALNREHPELRAQLDEQMAAAKTSLANSLVAHFGK